MQIQLALRYPESPGETNGENYKQYETQAAYSAAVLLTLLAVVTLIAKEILERKTRIKEVE